MKFKFYEYEKCSTCVNARKWMDANGIDYERIAIRKFPPKKKELELLFNYHEGKIIKMFNTSGIDYRSMKIKEKLPNLSQREALNLLLENGNLNKRPILLGKDTVLQGFQLNIWENALV